MIVSLKKNKQPIATEYEECKVFAEWLRLKKLMFSHIPHGTYAEHISVRMKNKRMGLNRGVPDYIIITPRGLAFVEMKRQKGGMIYPEQKEWMVALNKVPNVEAKICKGSKEAIDFISTCFF